MENNDIVAELANQDKTVEEYDTKRDDVNGWFDSALKAARWLLIQHVQHCTAIDGQG